MFWLLMVFVFATLAVLFTGIFFMARGGEVNEKYSNKLMVARVTLQALAIGILGIMFLLK